MGLGRLLEACQVHEKVALEHSSKLLEGAGSGLQILFSGVVAILFVRFWSSRNYFRPDFRFSNSGPLGERREERGEARGGEEERRRRKEDGRSKEKTGPSPGGEEKTIFFIGFSIFLLDL